MLGCIQCYLWQHAAWATSRTWLNTHTQDTKLLSPTLLPDWPHISFMYHLPSAEVANYLLNTSKTDTLSFTKLSLLFLRPLSHAEETSVPQPLCSEWWHPFSCLFPCLQHPADSESPIISCQTLEPLPTTAQSGLYKQWRFSGQLHLGVSSDPCSLWVNISSPPLAHAASHCNVTYRTTYIPKNTYFCIRSLSIRTKTSLHSSRRPAFFFSINHIYKSL